MNTNVLIESSRGISCVSTEDKLFSERRIFFTESITPESSAQLIRALLYLENEDPDKEIVLYINSPGGEVQSGISIFDTIMGLRCPVRTVCIGTAASMGSIIFLAGSVREVLPHSQIMIHDPLINGLSGAQKALSLEKEAEKLMQTRMMLGKILAERTGRTLDEVFEKTKEDTYLNSDEALEFGIATAVAGRA